MASFFRDIQWIKVSLRIKYYEPTRKTGWEEQWCTCSWSFYNNTNLNYNMNDNQALMTCEVEDIKKHCLLCGELKMEKTITCIEPYFIFIFHPKTDKFNYHVEWIVYFWDSGALTDHYFTIVL